MLRRVILTVCFILILVQGAIAADIPQIADESLEQALALGGANRAQLEQALFSCQQKPFTMEAMRFLIANLPAADLGVVQAQELVQHVELAMQARAEFAFCKDYDDAAWAHYVLPPRVSQEPLSAWRPYFYEQLRNVVADCTTREEVAVKINAWCGERVKYKPTQSRDQGPLVTLKSGYGRCEEMMIFFICASRSVGLPVRQAYCPYWSINDDNHAWSEVLGSDGRWHYLGACEPSPKLDDAWFNAAVKNAPLIVSTCFGLPETAAAHTGQPQLTSGGEEVLVLQNMPGARYCQLNSTGNYRRIERLALEARTLNEGARLGVYVFNYGALRLIIRVPFIDGKINLALGAGTYVLSTSSHEGPHAVLYTVDPSVDSLSLWEELPPLPAEMMLAFPADPGE
jgi:hypothetical protein